MMRRLMVALEMRRIPGDRPYALRYLLGRHRLARWEEDLMLSPRAPQVIVPGPTKVSGLAGEAECPASHWDLKADEACIACGAAR